MITAEYALFKTDDPDTRFHKIYDKLANMEVQHKKDIDTNCNLRETIKQNFDDSIFKIDNQIQSLRNFKTSYESLSARTDDMMKSIESYMDASLVKVQHYFRRMDELSIKTMDELQDIRNFNHDVIRVKLDNLNAWSTDHDEKITRAISEIA